MSLFSWLPRCVVCLGLLLGAATATAETLAVPAPQAEDRSLPRRGQSMDQVQAAHGPPQSRHGPVGGGHPRRPPISRWEYPGFFVVFERDRVIEAVRPDQPTQPRLHEGGDALEVRSEPLTP